MYEIKEWVKFRNFKWNTKQKANCDCLFNRQKPEFEDKQKVFSSEELRVISSAIICEEDEEHTQ